MENEGIPNWGASEQLEFLRGAESTEALLSLLDSSTEVPRAPWSLDLLETHHRPGAGITGLYEATAPCRDSVFVCATTEQVNSSERHVATLSSAGRTVSVWLHPYDPRLPGLASASVPATVQRLWATAGVSELQTLAYRPLRRAVLRAKLLDGSVLFLKVLHKDAPLLAARHDALARAGVPVPRVIEAVPGAGAPHDVVALGPASGRSVAQALMDGESTPVSAQALIDVLDRFPRELLEFPLRPAWSERIEEHASAGAVAFPALQADIDAVLAHVLELVSNEPVGGRVPSHGDLYEANVFAEAGTVSSLLDLDGVGPGHRVDDLACFLGHLAVLPELSEGYHAVPAYVDSLAGRFESNAVAHGSSARALWGRAAAVVLSLVAGVADEGHDDARLAAARRLTTARGLVERAWRCPR